MKKIVLIILFLAGVCIVATYIRARKPYLDIKDITISHNNGYYLAKITMDGKLPTKIRKGSLLEWNIFIDSDINLETGWKWVIAKNWMEYIGIEYLIRLELEGNCYKGKILEIKSHKWREIKYEIKDNVINLSFLPSDIGNSKRFNYCIVTRYQKKKTIIPSIFSQLPSKGYLVFPDTDGDGFADDDELNIYKTNPNVKEKWEDLDTVVKILNTPEKISLYLKQKFLRIGKSGRPNLKDVFKKKAGDCDEYALLACYFLSKNGYPAYILGVDFDSWWERVDFGDDWDLNDWIAHVICVYKKETLWYTIDIYFYGENSVGPFKSIDEICNSLPSHYDDISKWNWYNIWTYDWKLVKRGKPTRNH